MVHWSRLGALVAVAATGCDPWISRDDRPGGVEGLWQADFAPMVDVSECRSGLTWCCQSFYVAADGSFSEEWAPNEPGTARFTGMLYEDHMEATLQCMTNGASVSIEAMLVGGAYDGTFTFGGSSGCLLAYPSEPSTVSLQGRVVSGTGAAVAGATVWTSLQDRVATTNAHGQFYLQTAVEPHLSDDTSYTVRAWAPGYETYEGSAPWGDHPTGLELMLTPR